MYMQATDLDSPAGTLLATLTIAALCVLGLVGCDGGPVGQDSQRPADSDPTPMASAPQGPGQSSQACENVKGTAEISGSVVPNSQGNVVASGPVTGDVSGTLTLIRSADATTQQGNGLTFAFYKEASLETDQFGPFTGTATGNINIGLGEEGRRSNRTQVHIDYDGPKSKRGFMKMNGPFDFSDFPPVIKATLKYSGRLCPGN